MTALIYIASFLVLLGVLVTIHEYGHFFFARLFKVHVQRFSIGMGPVVYKRLDKHGTEIALSLLPLGGYVSMITNKLIELEPEIKNQLTEEQAKNTFDSKPKWQRACIMFAGPLANFLLSIFLFSIIFFNTPDSHVVTVINDVDSSINFKSSNQFILPGDQISSIDSARIIDPNDLQLELLSYSGHTGYINLNIKRVDVDDLVDVSIYVEDFMGSSAVDALNKAVDALNKERQEIETSSDINNDEKKILFESLDIEIAKEIAKEKDPLNNLGLAYQYKTKPIVGQVLSNGSAENGNIKPNDIILKIDNSTIEYFSDIESAVSSIPNRSVLVQVLRDDEILKLPITIGVLKKDGKEVGVLGVSRGTDRSFAQSLSIGVFKTYSYSEKTLQFIGKMLTGNMGTDGLSGPIGIAEMAGKSAQRGFIAYMSLMALLSISLAVLNLLPIPVLDGGQLTLLGIEALRGKPLPEKVENYIYTSGAFLVIALMIFAVFNDVARFF